MAETDIVKARNAALTNKADNQSAPSTSLFNTINTITFNKADYYKTQVGGTFKVQVKEDPLTARRDSDPGSLKVLGELLETTEIPLDGIGRLWEDLGRFPIQREEIPDIYMKDMNDLKGGLKTYPGRGFILVNRIPVRQDNKQLESGVDQLETALQVLKRDVMLIEAEEEPVQAVESMAVFGEAPAEITDEAGVHYNHFIINDPQFRKN